MRIAFPACGAAVVLAVCSFAGSEAATISSSISTGPLMVSGSGDYFSVTIPDFDSSLGTLVSVTASLGGSYLDTPIPGFPDQPYFELDSKYNTFFSGYGTMTSVTGTYSYSGSGTVSDAMDLAVYSSAAPGTTHIEFEVADGGTLTSTDFTGTLTYTYTPAVVTPPAVTAEPPSLLLLGTGALGAAAVMRRRSLDV